MRHDKAVKKVEKALGVKVESLGGSRYGCEYDGMIISWIASPSVQVSDDGKIVRDGPLDAHNWHMRRVDDVSDPYTDYFAGYFVDNVTQLIHACKPPEPKYKPGQLVRGKQNKRAKRWGFAGKVGLVTDSGSGQARVLWNGEEPTRSYFSERDLELVSG